MRIAHVSDLHLGASLRSIPRAFEHRQFLAWLLDRLAAEGIDVLLVTGDVFDNQNPPATAQALFYDFLVAAHRRLPRLQVVVIGGNHDSGHRLEAPAGLMRGVRAQVVGTLPRDSQGRPDPASVVLPLEGPDGSVEAWCVAMPFLRPADLPLAGDGTQLDVVAGTRAVYQQAFGAARARAAGGGGALLALGHCFMAAGLASADSERPILIGGEAALPLDLFPPDVAYVGLGHLHRPQMVGGRAELLYAGSPIPLSLAERGYRHRLVIVENDRGARRLIRDVPIPRWVEMLRIPDQGALPPDALLAELAALAPDADPDHQPFLEVAVALTGPEPGLRAQIEAALDGKPVRLVRITEARPGGDGDSDAGAGAALDLDALDPLAVFRRRWARDYPGEPPAELTSAFETLLVDAGQGRPDPA